MYSHANLDFSPDWDEVSNLAKDFISNIIVVDPKNRMTASQAYEHKWLSESVDEPISKNLITKVGNNLVKHFSARRMLKAGMNAIKFISSVQHSLSASPTRMALMREAVNLENKKDREKEDINITNTTKEEDETNLDDGDETHLAV